jgi:hypothetical protein
MNKRSKGPKLVDWAVLISALAGLITALMPILLRLL